MHVCIVLLTCFWHIRPNYKLSSDVCEKGICTQRAYIYFVDILGLISNNSILLSVVGVSLSEDGTYMLCGIGAFLRVQELSIGHPDSIPTEYECICLNICAQDNKQLDKVSMQS